MRGLGVASLLYGFNVVEQVATGQVPLWHLVVLLSTGFVLLTAFGRQITGVFNIADMAIMGGVITMLILSFFPPKETEAAESESLTVEVTDQVDTEPKVEN